MKNGGLVLGACGRCSLFGRPSRMVQVIERVTQAEIDAASADNPLAVSSTPFVYADGPDGKCELWVCRDFSICLDCLNDQERAIVKEQNLSLMEQKGERFEEVNDAD